MKIFFDTEFYERPHTIDLISIGMISEDGRELYLESSDANLNELDPWLEENVVPHLHKKGVSREVIRDRIIEFIGDDPNPEFWAYFADYDWVVFCWLFGRMIDLPRNFPRYCKDFKQSMDEWGLTKEDLPKKPRNVHYALADARWLRDAYNAAIHKGPGY